MDTKALKSTLLEKIASLNIEGGPDFTFNQRYAGAKFDLERLRAGHWTDLEAERQGQSLWMERLFRIEDGLIIEFRVCFSTAGYWRDADIFELNTKAMPDKVRVPSKQLPREIVQSVENELDNAKIGDFPSGMSAEYESLFGPKYRSKIPDGRDENDYALSLWCDYLGRRLESDPVMARRQITGAVRNGCFCQSGEALANAAFTSHDLGMLPEAEALSRCALDEDSDNSAEYWNMLGGLMQRLGFLNESFNCLCAARRIDPSQQKHCNNIRTVGRMILPKSLADQNFEEIIRVTQVMLGCVGEITAEEKARLLCALGLGYEGKGDLEEAATYYSLASEAVAPTHEKDAVNDQEEYQGSATWCPMATFGLHRLADTIPDRRAAAFQAQVACFPLTPAEAGWEGAAPVTYVEETHHGGHWHTVVEDVQQTLSEHFQRILSEGSVEGVAEYPPSEIGTFGYEQGIGLEYPPAGKSGELDLRVFVLNGKKVGADAAEWCSGFPVFGSGVLAEMTLEAVNEWVNGVEADVRMLLTPWRPLGFFVPDYYRDRSGLKKGRKYLVELAGFAYTLERFTGVSYQIDKGPMLEEEKARLRAEGKSDEIDSVPVVIGEDASFITPRMIGGDRTDCEFLGKVSAVTSTEFFGNTVYRVVVTLNLDSDMKLELPIFVGQHKLQGEVPEVGAAVAGVLWLQGILRKDLDEPGDLTSGNSAYSNLRVDWAKDFDDFRSPEGIVWNMLGRLNPVAMDEINASLGCDPVIVLRIGSENLFVHVTKEEVEDEGQLRKIMRERGVAVLEYNKGKGMEVAQVGIGLVKQGEGFKILYAGFDELERKYRSAL